MSQFPPSLPPTSYPPNEESNAGVPSMAIAALVCGIVGFFFAPAALIGLILGIVFLSKTRDGKPGRGMALAGAIAGALSLVIAAIVVLVIFAILLPSTRAASQRMQSITQLRAIHQGMVIFANSNKNYFPGFDSRGDVISNGAITTGNSGDGNTPQARYWILLDGDYFTPEYAISPSETEPIVPYVSGHVLADNYSYAMLSVMPNASGRAAEWTQSLNSQAIVLSDRNTGTNGTNMVDSVHSGSPGSWEGSVLWNDNFVSFERTQFFETKYDSGTVNGNDNIFEDDGTGGYDAIMKHD